MKRKDKAIYNLIRMSNHGLDTHQLVEYSGRGMTRVHGSIIRLRASGHIVQNIGHPRRVGGPPSVYFTAVGE